jgi:hypothetical protein
MASDNGVSWPDWPDSPGGQTTIGPAGRKAEQEQTRVASGRISIFEKLRAQAKSSKFQTPSSKEAPGPKHQTPSAKLQRRSKLEAQAVVWSLELGISLVFGAWFLVFRFRNFSGAWDLVLGVSLSRGLGGGVQMRQTQSM